MKLLIALTLAALMQTGSFPVKIAGNDQLIHLSFPAGQSYACVDFKSLTEDYTPGKCGFVGRKATSIDVNWDLINCTLDDLGRPHPRCPNHKEWEVSGFVQGENPDGTPGEPVRSNSIVVVYN